MINETEILNALKAETGCDFAQVDEAALLEKIRRILADHPEPEALAGRKSLEWESLLHDVLVPETWFFRNPEAFGAFAAWATEAGASKRPLLILSLPCATGEEPYSIAMTLLEAGWEPDRFRIIGGDIGTRFLEKAKDGNYTRNAFRAFDEVRYGHYFESLPNGQRRLKDEIRKLVRFKQLNLIHGELPDADAVFCRNALIYLDSAGQAAALERIHALLPDDGALFLGPVEPPLAVRHGFSVLPYPMAFACRKAASGAVSRPVSPSPEAGATRRATVAKNRFRRRHPIRPTVLPRPAAPPPLVVVSEKYPAVPSFEQIRELADRGDLCEAAELLNRLAAAVEPSAELYCLSGIINEVGGRREAAEQFYRKALFLDPDHTESLLHLGLLLEIDGRHTVARAINQRLQRQQAL